PPQQPPTGRGNDGQGNAERRDDRRRSGLSVRGGRRPGQGEGDEGREQRDQVCRRQRVQGPRFVRQRQQRLQGSERLQGPGRDGDEDREGLHRQGRQGPRGKVKSLRDGAPSPTTYVGGD